MKILQRYLAKTLLETTLLVVLIVLGLEIFIAFLSELRAIGQGSYSVFSAFIYVLLDLPAQLYMLFPMVGLLGILLGLSVLTNHHELTIFRTSGISIFRISWMIIKVAILMILLITVMGEWIAPKLERTAESYKIIRTSNGQVFKTIHGLWVRDQNKFIHVDTVVSKDTLAKVTVYEFDKTHRLISSLFSETATYHKPVWLFKKVLESNVNEHQITSESYPEKIVSMSLDPKVIQLSRGNPESLSLKQLIRYIHFLDSNHLKDANYDFAFWSRILQPFATLTMMLLAVPFVFGPLRSTTRSLRLLVGILFGFGFYILNQFFGPISIVYQFPPLFAALLPILVFATLGIFLTYRANRSH